MLVIGACSSDSTQNPASTTNDDSTAEVVEQESSVTQDEIETESAPDLSGTWTQTNSNAEDSYQAATISSDSIEVYWVSDGGDTRSLYWAGTFDAPTSAGAHEWESENDAEKTSVAILASSAPTKTFTHEDGEISYEVSALGTTTVVRLGRDE